MDISTIRDIVHENEPFYIHTIDGKSWLVPHPDFIALGPDDKASTVTFYKSDGRFVIIDLFNIASLELAEQKEGKSTEP